ncbi:SDR family NAD(P)-dependent oxidoreductase [bacterium]|nr:MAG: SDR family NAD(P)-dependent oxidoreductase [bacterium]
MSVSLKPLDQQVIVITGASSGIGLTTAHSAVKAGAKLVVTARSKQTLDGLVAKIEADGGEAIAVVADIGVKEEVQKVADAAIARFGRIDTWVNDAGLGIFGKLEEVSDEDNRRLFDTNFWGIVYGSQVALPHLKKQGGALINLGSEVSEGVIPLQGMYAASKHAVKGFTDALRVELEIDEAPVSVILIQPTAVDTPFPQHAANYMDEEPKLPTPMIDPQKVADAILRAATHGGRDVKVGVMSIVDTLAANLVPGLADKMFKAQKDRQQYDEPPRHSEGALHAPAESGQTHGSGGIEK